MLVVFIRSLQCEKRKKKSISWSEFLLIVRRIWVDCVARTPNIFIIVNLAHVFRVHSAWYVCGCKSNKPKQQFIIQFFISDWKWFMTEMCIRCAFKSNHFFSFDLATGNFFALWKPFYLYFQHFRVTSLLKLDVKIHFLIASFYFRNWNFIFRFIFIYLWKKRKTDIGQWIFLSFVANFIQFHN